MALSLSSYSQDKADIANSCACNNTCQEKLQPNSKGAGGLCQTLFSVATGTPKVIIFGHKKGFQGQIRSIKVPHSACGKFRICLGLCEMRCEMRNNSACGTSAFRAEPCETLCTLEKNPAVSSTGVAVSVKLPQSCRGKRANWAKSPELLIRIQPLVAHTTRSEQATWPH